MSFSSNGTPRTGGTNAACGPALEPADIEAWTDGSVADGDAQAAAPQSLSPADNRQSTEWRPANCAAHSRLSSARSARPWPDVSLCHRSLAGRAEWQVREDVGSDHLPITVTIHGSRGAAKRASAARRAWAKADWAGFGAQTEEALAGWEASPPATATRANQRLTEIIKAADSAYVPRGHVPPRRPGGPRRSRTP